MICYVVIFLFLIAFYLFTKNQNYWRSRDVPFEKPFLFFGSFYSVATRKQHIFHILRAIYNNHNAPYVGIHIFTQPHLMLRSPQLIKKVLVTDFDKFQNRNFAANESADPISFYSLFSSQDGVWKNLRARVSPIFTSSKIKLMFPLMKECALDLNDYLSRHKDEDVDVKLLTKKYSVDIISSCAFGIQSFCLRDEDSEIMKMAAQLLTFNSFIRSVSALCFSFVHAFVHIFRLRFLDKTASDYLSRVFKSVMKEREEKKIIRNDLIDSLRNLKKSEDSEDYMLNDVKMAAQAISFFSAGNATISLTMSFALYELALNQDIQERLRHEINDSFDKNGGISYDSIQEMKYLDMVFSETLRKYPLTSYLNRKSTSKYVFKETGFCLDKNVAVLIPIAGLHYDPEFFSDPEKFDPERFNDDNKTKIQPFTYLPFGEGPRNCIGQRFGQIVSKVGLAYAIKDFVFVPTVKTTIPLKFNPSSIFLQNKGGVYLKATKI